MINFAIQNLFDRRFVNEDYRQIKYLEKAINKYKNNGLLSLKMFAEGSKFLY